MILLVVSSGEDQSTLPINCPVLKWGGSPGSDAGGYASVREWTILDVSSTATLSKALADRILSLETISLGGILHRNLKAVSDLVIVIISLHW